MQSSGQIASSHRTIWLVVSLWTLQTRLGRGMKYIAALVVVIVIFGIFYGIEWITGIEWYKALLIAEIYMGTVLMLEEGGL